MKNIRSLSIIFILFSAVFISSCKKDDDKETANFNLKMTDAPIDNAEVKAVFVTVADVKLDGQSIEGFNKTTFDLSAYQNGKTMTLFNSDVELDNYSSITLVLDYQKDANGNEPGTYVEKQDGTKEQLSNDNTAEFTTSVDVSLESSNESNYVIDFDLRKAIRTSAEGNYYMASSSESSLILRAVVEGKSGMIKGKAEDQSANGMNGSTVVYAYTKGSYNQDVETKGDLMFKNSVSSAMVDASGNYTLAFLNEGNYELHFANYEDTNNDGKLEFQGMVRISAVITGTLFDDVNVSANGNVNLDIALLGLL